jgi:hypothetical protein
MLPFNWKLSIFFYLHLASSPLYIWLPQRITNSFWFFIKTYLRSFIFLTKSSIKYYLLQTKVELLNVSNNNGSVSISAISLKRILFLRSEILSKIQFLNGFLIIVCKILITHCLGSFLFKILGKVRISLQKLFYKLIYCLTWNWIVQRIYHMF